MTPLGKARLFGGGSPPTGEDADLAVFDRHIEVRTAAQVHAPAVDELRFREVGSVQAGIELAWESSEGLRAVQIFDPATLQKLRAHPTFRAHPQVATLEAKGRYRAAGRVMGWTLIATFVLLPILLLLAFVWQSDRIALAVAKRLPVEQEVALGRQAFASMRGSMSMEEGGPRQEAVRALGERLKRGSPYIYEFHVVKDDTLNAFALPGGIIVVNTGLIDATRRPEELAGVLAHEVEHVEQRHSLQAVVKDLGLRSLWLLLTGDIGSGVLGQAALELTSLRFSRAAESMADAAGFQRLIAAGIDPRGMADFFNTMSEREEAATPPPFLSTHPGSDDREATLRARESELAGRYFAPLDLGPWPPALDPSRADGLDRDASPGG
jgi:Zn-dependent protease with chaperone function